MSDRISLVLDDQIRQIWAKYLGVSRIENNTDFYNAGGNSLTALQATQEIRESLGLKIGVSLLFKNSVFIYYCGALRNQLTQTKSPQLKFIAIGYHPFYYELEQHLGVNDQVSVYPEVNTDEFSGFRTHDDLASYYCEAIEQRDPSCSVVIIGYSSAGRLAFRVAEKLKRYNRHVPLVVVIDSAIAPFRADIVRKFHRYYFRILSSKGKFQYISGLAKKVATNLRSRLRKSSAKEHDPTIARVHWIDSLQESKMPRFTGIPLLVLVSNVRKRSGLLLREDLGWGKFTSGTLKVVELKGNHVSILSEINLEIVAEAMQAFLVDLDLKH